MKVCYKPHLKPDLVSTKIETTYDAVSKLKAVYETAITKTKAAFSEAIDSVAKEAEVLSVIDIGTNLDEEISERIDQADFSSLSKITNANDIPAVAKDIASKVCREIAYVALESEKKFVTSAKTSAGKIHGLALSAKDIISHISGELDKELVVVNDLWSIKDQEIANLEANLKNSIEELNLLEEENKELKERIKQLEEQVVTSLNMALTDQSQLQDKQQSTTSKIDEILKTKVNTYVIDTTPLQDEKETI